MPTINVQDLTIRYGDIAAVNGLTFDVEPGHVLGLVGGNGAGKSSTLRAIAGVNPPTSGTVIVDGHDLSDRHSVAQAQMATGYCPDVGGLLAKATIREHIALSLAFRRQTHQWGNALDLLDRFGLSEALDRPVGAFSHGMSRRLSVMLAVLASTQVLILDEPFDGVDPLGVETTLKVIQEAKTAGVAVLVSTHLLPLLVECSDSVLVMVQGSQVDRGDATQFSGDLGASRYERLLRGTA